MAEKTLKASWKKTFLLTLGYLIMAWVGDVILMVTLPMGQSKLEASGGFDNMTPGAILLLGCVIAPLIEEFLCRFLLFNGLRFTFRKVGGWFIKTPEWATWAANLAIVGSALVFALMHQETVFGLFLMRFMFGFLAAHLYMKTGRFVSNLSLHMLHNALPLVLAVAFAGHV